MLLTLVHKLDFESRTLTCNGVLSYTLVHTHFRIIIKHKGFYKLYIHQDEYVITGKEG